MKKNRLSFSALSVDNKKTLTPTPNGPARSASHSDAGGEHKTHDKKRTIKSSTYQYVKKGFRQNRNHKHHASGRSSYKNISEGAIPPPEEGVIRIIPLGGVEEIGKNMTAIEIGDDIIVIDAGMHFSNEETPGVDYVIPNTTYLEERKEKIRALIVTHGHLDHIGGVPLVLSRIGN
ncbi:MBL fold metallo-hydrolase, partial [Candidatus Nomurabacteria bacterium]|nr:MBL fold metallo-hydrolase [Candidatus Nomurabacteria bacterium]